MNKTTWSFLIILIIYMMASCSEGLERIDIYYYSEDEFRTISETLDLPEDHDDYSVTIPNHLFFNGKNQMNLASNAKATLGRVLFYDTRLSTSGTVSCASCHRQEFAFADNEIFSKGVFDQNTERNTLSLAASPNLSASYDSPESNVAFGWDHANPESSSQSKAAMLNQKEMGNFNIQEIINRLDGDPAYVILTRKAYALSTLEEFIILESLDAFMNSISSFNSRFDDGLKKINGFSPKPNFTNFTNEENNGKALFLKHCSSCHGSKHDIQVKQIANNGLDLEYEDKGVGFIEGPEFNGLFKVPFLRNIELTAPYMHDGRFVNLEEVIEHYNSGIQSHLNLSKELFTSKNGIKEPLKLNLQQREKDELVAFLKTLTDKEVTQNIKYSDPFK